MPCASAATGLTASIPGSELFWEPARSRPQPASNISSTPGNWAWDPAIPTASSDHIVHIIARERRPVFVLAYLTANHFPWTYRHRSDLLTDWVNAGNPSEIDEYLRRQE